MDKSSHTKERRTVYQALIETLGVSPEAIQNGVDLFLTDFRTMILEVLMESEVNELIGLPYERSPKKRTASRWGYEQGVAIVDGGKTPIIRPRVRFCRGFSEQSGEFRLETYEAMNRADLIDGPLTAAILGGVSTRVYSQLICRNLKKAKGVKRSSVSRKALAASKPMVDQFLKQRIDIEPVVLMIDGVNIGGCQALACLGIDTNGRKHVLGVRIGSTENQIVCRDLLRDMIERGLDPEASYLFVIDGSKALAGAIRACFGQDVQIQRCQEHKIRDVQAYLPVKLRKGFRQKLIAAYAQKSARQALAHLDKIRGELTLISESAANALTEGMFETLTVHRLGITGKLRKALRTTNIVESAFSAVRRYLGRVTRFRNDQHREIWLVRSLLEAERHFRTVEGHRQIAPLRNKLQKKSKTR